MSTKTFKYKDIRTEAYRSACSRRLYLNHWGKNPYTCFKARFYLEFSSILIYFLLRTNINPNSVTIAYGLAGVLGGILLAIPNTTTILIALVLFFTKGVLDWSDGHIARATNQTSLTGHILDVYGAHLNSLGLQIGLGFYVAAKSNLALFYYLIPLIPFFYATGVTNFAKQLLFEEALKKKREQVKQPGTPGSNVIDGVEKDGNANKNIVNRFRFLIAVLDDRARSVDFILLLILIEVFYPSVFVTWVIFLALVAKALVIFLGKFYLVAKKSWVENNTL